jgi:hypothetical protein
MLLPIHFYSLNSLPLVHTHSTTTLSTNAAGPSSPLAKPDIHNSGTRDISPLPHSESVPTSPTSINPATNHCPPGLPSDSTPTANSDDLVPLSPLAPPLHDIESADFASASPLAPSPHISTLTVPPPHRVTRSQTDSLKPKSFPDFKLYTATKHPLQSLLATTLPREPTSYKQAASNPKWHAAMESEFQALLDNHTWTLCPRPPHRNIIKKKWVYKLKQKVDGTIDRYKARLVAKGFQQQDGIDYTETFSPVIKPATIRLILALALNFNWPLKQLDVSNAFLHGVLTEEVFMEQPQGFVHPQFPNHVCKLGKSLYDLKQAPRAWFHRLPEALLDRGFIGSKVDTSLFLLHTSSLHIFFLVYVDDIIVTGNNLPVINNLISSLQEEFKLKDLGSLSYFLGIHVLRDQHHLHLSQSKYIVDLLHHVNMDGAKPYSAPCTSGKRLSASDRDPLPDPTLYRHIIGALQYCTLTRPDISFTVNQLCQFLHCPTTTHFSAAKRVLRYLKRTLDFGLLFTKGSLHLHAYWAGDPSDRRSTGGYGVFLGSSLISWHAKKQPVVSRSSTEAKYRSLATTTAELYWLRMLFRELQVYLPTPPNIWCDNMGAIALASNPIYHARTKHVEVDYHFIR